MANKSFPDECCQCGMCCLSMTCEIGQRVFNIPEDELCHALVFESNVAVCRLAPYAVPVGDGCCIKARIFICGVEYQFASLPIPFKKMAASQVRKNALLLISKGVVKWENHFRLPHYPMLLVAKKIVRKKSNLIWLIASQLSKYSNATNTG